MSSKRFALPKAVPVLAGIPLCLASAGVLAQAVPGGTLDPTTIPKYVTPLVIPPVLYDDQGTSSSFTVAQRQILQQVLPAGFPATPLWAYGNPDDPATFNNPSFTFEITKDVETKVTWRNELVVDPEKCYRGAGNKGGSKFCNYLPHIIQDANGNPLIDQTLHWAAPNQDCIDGVPRTDCRGTSDQPYFGPIPMVVHVHGAHVGPGSDGYPEAWWLPDANNIPKTFATNGTFFESDDGDDTLNAIGQGYAIDRYPNDQPTTTLWYHDHTLGITRLNVYAAGAGFWLIRDTQDGETGLLQGTLPGPAPKLGEDPNCLGATGQGPGNSQGKGQGKAKGRTPAANCVRETIREIPLAIQPKSFNEDGTQFYPADRIFFQQDERPTADFPDNDGQAFAENLGLNIALMPQAGSDIAPVWNPEAFFNAMVVNGKTWPQLEVASERYRFRILNAADSRFLNMAMFVVNPDGSLGDEIPFYQIGAEQGLLPAVVRIQTGEAVTLPEDGTEPPPNPDLTDPTALLVGPAERADVIVDFGGLPNGSVIRMVNTAPDAPFGGFPDAPADPGTTGQVMQFVVNNALNTPGGDPSSPPADLELDDNPGGVAKLGSPDKLQDLALLEEESADICFTFDAVAGTINEVVGSTPPLCEAGGVPFGPQAAVLGVDGSGDFKAQLWDDPIAQNPALDSIEEWELWNRSADAHPMHLHLVKFEVVNRQVIGGAVRPPEPWEAGWKDTVIAYPGEVTRIKAKFDIPGLYVWHCHILSHEDNEMMVPFCVGEPGEHCPGELF